MVFTKKRVSVSTVRLNTHYGILGSIDVARQIGADAVDFDLSCFNYKNRDSIYSKCQDEFVSFFESVKSHANTRGIEICQTHGRRDPFKENDEEYNNTIFPKNAELDLKATKILGAPVCVFHPGGTLSNRNTTPENMRKNAFNAFKMILPFAKENGVKIALETAGAHHSLGDVIDFFGTFDEYRALYDRIAAVPGYADCLSCCIDVGHINLTVKHNQPIPADFIRKMGKNISCLHLHDNNGYIDQHRIPCTGTIDWEDVFNALNEIGYDGFYNAEVNFHYISRTFMAETAEFTVKTLRHLLSKY